jgi:hypothetical protein
MDEAPKDSARFSRSKGLLALGAMVVVTLSSAGLAQTSDATRPPPTRASSEARDAALRVLANKLDLPLVQETVATFSQQLRRTLPGVFVNAVGQGAGLGSRWKRGNAYFDEALRQVDGALGAEEARGGPLLTLDRGDLLYAVNVPWTESDIAFLIDTTDTELGRQAQRAIDAKATLQMTGTLSRRIGSQPGARSVTEAFGDIEERAKSQYADASLMLVALKGADPQRAKRLQSLIEAVDTTPADALGKRLADKLSQRLLDAAAAQLPNLIAIVAGFRNAYP